MGLFDTIWCKYKLPNEAHQDRDFQTKSLGPNMDVYTITEDGHLTDERGVLPFSGEVVFYTCMNPANWIEYVAVFQDGKLVSLKQNPEQDLLA